MKQVHNDTCVQAITQCQCLPKCPIAVFRAFPWKNNLESITVGCPGYKYKSYVRLLICEDHMHTLLLIERQSVGRIKLNYERLV
jgi:hypothetical protein